MIKSSTEHLKRQWADAAARVGLALDPNFKNADGSHGSSYMGAAVTYAQVANKPLLHRARTEAGRSLVIGSGGVLRLHVLKDRADDIVHERGEVAHDIAATRPSIVLVTNAFLRSGHQRFQPFQEVRSRVVAVQEGGKGMG